MKIHNMEVERWVYEIAENTVNLYQGKKLIIWGDYIISWQIKAILADKYGVETACYVDQDARKINDRTVFPTTCLKGKSKECFVVIPIGFYQNVKDQMEEYGFSPRDYYYYNDCVIVDRADYYEDRRGNRIIGEHENIKVIFNGYDATVRLGKIQCEEDFFHIHAGNKTSITIGDACILKTCIMAGDDAVVEFGKGCRLEGSFKLGNNASLYIGEGGAIINLSKFVLWDFARVRVGMECMMETCTFTVCSKSECIIGNKCTAGVRLTIIVSEDTTLEIGDDCLFSWDLTFITHDMHSIFDVSSGKNVNSLPQIRETKKIIVGNHVWIGAYAFILYHTVIGDGSIIGAKSLVKGKIPNNCIAVGCPAKVSKKNIAWSGEDGAEDIASCGMEYVHYTEE